ncbi:Vacuolar protein sorting-associated protein 5 [Apophysomyces sp. BC1034]|nr:Vacuolar protein sorting-associated protein 5 [Apophysomyces sp. BC1015]KAG0177460.1 Vacuolar protein sorting-associated protein 5 [Apophysomyces sp. BC1021]KAG0186034.1 Vacuolar protein sorting-associated protein 5 [Apophysomyces sp. BC1034]
MALTLAVPEAAASIDTIQFKLMLGGEGLSDYMNRHDLVVSTAFRSFQQISWLHEKLTLSFPAVVVPPLPDPPLSSRMDDQDYVERKRLQAERFFDKIIRRKVFADHADFTHFMSTDMAPTEVGRATKGVLSFLRFNRIRPNTDRGFRSYKVTEPVEGNDQDTFHRHQIYILMLESYYGSIAESLAQLIQVREGLGDVMARMGDLVIETSQSKYRLGDGIKEGNREAQRVLDRRMQLFGLLMDEFGFIFTRQTVFNARTQKLMEYVDSVKHRNKKRDKADKLKLRMGLAAPEVQATMIEEQEATEGLDLRRQQFDACQANVKEEIRVFEAQKRRDVTRSINDYVQVNLRYERAKLQSLEKALDEMRHFTPKPILLAHGLLTMAAEDDDLSSSTTSTATFDTARRSSTRRRRQPHHRKEPQALQSSASLPTWTRKKADGHADSETAHPRVAALPRNDGQSRVHMSASYDERLGDVWSQKPKAAE